MVSPPRTGTVAGTPRAREQQAPPLVILNPAGNRGRAARLRRPIASALTGGRGELVLTDAPGSAAQLAREAALAGRAVVVVGGDGTVSEAANGLLSVEHAVPLGIVPAGSGNDYAREALRLPLEPLAALEVALTGVPRLVDVGRVGIRYFVNVLGVGLDAQIAARAERLKGSPLLRGSALYRVASIYELLLHYDLCPRVTVHADEHLAAAETVALAAVSIGPSYGGGFRINPQADAADGLFDLCALRKPPLLRALRLLPLVERGEHLGQPEVLHTRARRVTLEATRDVLAHVDGEVFSGQRFEAEVLPARLLVRHNAG